MDKKPEARPGHRLICRPYVTTKTGRRIYRKDGKMFCFWVKDK